MRTIARLTSRARQHDQSSDKRAFALLVVLAALAAAAPTASAAAYAPSPPELLVHPPSYAGAAARLPAPGGVTEFTGFGPCSAEVAQCWSPGEPTLAVGASDVVQTVNTVASVYSKTGARLAQFDLSTFWGASQKSCVDPHALYIPTASRFAFSCSDETGAKPVRFAISKTSDPTGAWYRYEAPNTEFLDQDKIEATQDKFIVAGNANGEQLYVYNLSEVVAGAAKPQVVHLVGTQSTLYQAAVQETPTPNGYFVSSYPGGGLWLATVSGTPAAKNVALQETSLAESEFAAPSEPQVPGGAIGGGDLDGRVYDAVYEKESSDGKPVIAYSSARACGLRTCITSARIDLSGATPALTENALIGEPGFDYSYGAVALNANGTPFEVYSRSSTTSAPGAAVVGPGFDVMLAPPTAATTSCAPEQAKPCDERWGDYLGAAIDPSEPSSVWVSGMYQLASGGGGWGTVIAKVAANSFSLPIAATGPASSVRATSAHIAGSVNPGSAASTYHVDYGLTTGYDASTPEQPIGSGSAPVAVSARIKGLEPGAVYHYRVVATSSVGSADGPDRTFETPSPRITAVHFTGTTANPTVTVSGSNFGSVPPQKEPSSPLTCVPGDTSFDYGSSGLWIEDVTQGWRAGQVGDCIGLIVSSFSNRKVVYQFGAGYGHYGPSIAAGDAYTLTVFGSSYSGTAAYS